jgi:hypothetical protein
MEKSMEFDIHSKHLLLDDSKIAAFLKHMEIRKQNSGYQQKKIDNQGLRTNEFEQLKGLVENLISGEYCFGVPQRIKINKMKTKKNRTVYVFEKNDKWLLQYINYVLNDVVHVHQQCYSFQRNKDIRESIDYLLNLNREGLVCIKTDISNYFNSIPIDEKNQWIQQNIGEYSSIVAMINNLLLETKVLVDGGEDSHLVHEKDGEKGVMAGMPLAPLLSNLYLYDFDEAMDLRFQGYARYSDDMVFFCKPEESEQSMINIEKELNQRGLSLNLEKTRVFDVDEGFEFLGLSFKESVVDLSSATIMKMKAKIKRATRSVYRWQEKKHVPYEKSVMVMIRKFNGKFYGYGSHENEFTWSRWFFPLINSTDGLSQIDHYFQETVRFLASGSYSKKNHQRIPYQLLKTYGYQPLVSAYYDGVHRPTDMSYTK